ncbi:MAG: hypothetical protein AAF467_13315 [Actinomycetota bacterium]
MNASRRYDSTKRKAKAEATRQAILEAFRDQLLEPGRDSLSPTDAATQAGCSVRTVHSYFPTTESRVTALAEWLEDQFYTEPLPLPTSVADLHEHYRRIHLSAQTSPLAIAFITQAGQEWQDVRRARRADRLQAVRDSVEAVGAPDGATAQATAMLMALAGAEITMIMREQFAIDDEVTLDAITHTVDLIVADLERAAQGD